MLKTVCDWKCLRLCANIKNKSSCKSGDLRTGSSWTELFRHHWQTLTNSFQSKQKVSARTWKGYDEEEVWTETTGWISMPVSVFTRLMPQQNPRLMKMTGRSALRTTTSRRRIPAKGEKVTYTSAVRWAREKCPVKARRRPHTSLENSAGICIVKGLRGARWGTDRPFVSRGITY